MQDTSYRAVTAELKRLGIPFTMDDGPHVKLRFLVNGHKKILVCNKSQSDYRAHKNNLSILRRMLREDDAPTAPTVPCEACARSFAKYGPSVHCSLACAEAVNPN